ncbi:hypothetical protein [Nocardia inohanensis]|uniref:hypothetical protein n=1 Tax=Nocardia inohanensis TaxID=209246 RepID=UPI000AD80F94|nr:hypothetical protein [Nocardia inohanensis]
MFGDRRVEEYAKCTYALTHQPGLDGREAVFDQALTNGLAVLVAHTWPGEEMKTVRGQVQIKSAAELLGVIKDKTGSGRIPHDLDNPVTDLPDTYDPLVVLPFTEVNVPLLKAAVVATQAIRHARETGSDTDSVLTIEHLAALAALDRHPKLGGITWVQVDRDWESSRANNDTEMERAHRFCEALEGSPELERRTGLDYEVEAFGRPDEPVDVEMCPVCGEIAFVARSRDGMTATIGVGHCWVCSYERTALVAEQMAVDAHIERSMDRGD